MPTLMIDGLEIEVPAGTKVIDAAERLGIMIPRFCYHEGLGSVGACRMCAVKFLKGPFKGVQMSCMIDAQDGMVVSTTDEEVLAFRKRVIEWLMLNHPHDCPVCDEGGQCLLQDETVSGGHGIRRYMGKKRTYQDQYLGVFISHEMNRCIHCYRCSRFYQEFAGYKDLGVLQTADRVYFGRFKDGQLESPFSGNLTDICPTGVYTDKTARYRVRRWDLERSPSLCIHCSLGCNSVANARYREVVRVEGRFDENVNGYFICDRGRFGFAYANLPERPRNARIGAAEVPLEEAIAAAAQRLSKIHGDSGGESIACLSSPRSSLENLSVLKRLCKLQNWRDPHYFENPSSERKTRRAVSKLDARLARSMRQLEQADFILAVGVDAINEAPMLALAMRQAHRREAVVAVMDPRPVFLPLNFHHLPVAPGDMDAWLDAFVRGVERRGGGESPERKAMQSTDESLPESVLDSRVAGRLSDLISKLESRQNPVIVCGTEAVRESTLSRVADVAEFLFESKGRSGLFYVLPGPNAFGAALLSPEGDRSFPDVIESIENGGVKALVVLESDPLLQFPDKRRLQQALDRLEFLLVLDHLPSGIAERAHIFLPTSTHFETGASFVNGEGRLQFAKPVHRGGIPIHQVGGGDHPPRIYTNEIPGGEPKAGWQILADIGRAMGLPQDEISPAETCPLALDALPFASALSPADYPFDGIRLIPEGGQGSSLTRASGAEAKPEPQGMMELLLVDWTFGTEELSNLSAVMRRVEREPVLSMHVDDGLECGLADGDRVVLHLDGGPLEVRLELKENMARGVLVLPRHRLLEWQKLREFPVSFPLDRISKASVIFEKK